MTRFGASLGSVALAIAASSCAGCSSSDAASADPGATDEVAERSAFVTDADGGAIILHGLNISGDAKYTPERQPWVEEEDVVRTARDWGFDASRYLIFWDAIEPSPGVYDEHYLDLVEQRLDWHAKAGLHVFLDMHQDLYSHAIAPPGDGAPEWAVFTDGLPIEPQVQWESYHLQPGVAAAYANFFDPSGPHPELQARYAAMFRHVAERFRHHPAVIGYEIMNEPYSMQALRDAKGYDLDWLTPFYARLVSAIREADPDGWIFYEPRAFNVSDGAASYLPKVADPRVGFPRLVFAPHAYPLVFGSSADDPGAIGAFVDRWAAARGADAKAYGTPLVVGEFHMTFGSNDSPAFLAAELATFDRLLAGWTYWDYTIGSDVVTTERVEKPILDQLVMTYARRVAGEPTKLAWDPSARTFDLEYRDRVGAHGETELFVPEKRHYPSGWTVTVSDAEGTWSQTWDATLGVLRLTLPRTGGTHAVHVAPK